MPGPLQGQKAGLSRLDLERARGEPCLRLHVERAGRHVVRRLGMEERGEQLDLAAAGAELPLPSAVRADLRGPRSSRTRRRAVRRSRSGRASTFTVFGGQRRLSMSSTEWTIASQVTRSTCGSSTASVSGVRPGSSSHAWGSPSATRRYRSASGGASTVVPRYCPLKSTESTAPVTASSSISSPLHSTLASSLKRKDG